MGLFGWLDDKVWEPVKGALPFIDSDKEKMEKMQALYDSGAQFPTPDQGPRHGIHTGPGYTTVGYDYSSIPAGGGPAQQPRTSPAVAGLVGDRSPYASAPISGMGESPASLSYNDPSTSFAARGLLGEGAGGGMDFLKALSPAEGGDRDDGLTGWEKGALVAQGLAGLGGAYGAWKQGQQRDKELEREREDYERRLRERDEAGKKLSPLLQKYMEGNF